MHWPFLSNVLFLKKKGVRMLLNQAKWRALPLPEAFVLMTIRCLLANSYTEWVEVKRLYRFISLHKEVDVESTLDALHKKGLIEFGTFGGGLSRAITPIGDAETLLTHQQKAIRAKREFLHNRKKLRLGQRNMKF